MKTYLGSLWSVAIKRQDVGWVEGGVKRKDKGNPVLLAVQKQQGESFGERKKTKRGGEGGETNRET